MGGPPEDRQGARASRTPERLDLALGWLERSLDDLTEATRRTAGLAVAAAPAREPAAPGAVRGDSPEAQPAARDPAERTVGGPAPGAPDPAVETESLTPLLDRIGRDLTALAAAGKLPPIIGRRKEMDWLVEILCRRSKRNPVLLGAAGAGKTAIVEGLAQRIAAGQVPELLRGVRLIEVPLASLVAGTEFRGQLEDRMQKLVVEASSPGIVLFFDEIHLLAGAGQSHGGVAIDEVLKPALGRGEIAVVGATTPEEYRATIEKDSALARRFSTVSIAELDRAATRPILRSVRDSLGRSRGVRVSDTALDVLLEFADKRIANRRFPDKAIDLLEQAVAAAIVAGRTRVDRADAVRTTERWSQRASSTPTLERFGRDLVRQARDGRIGPIVGREREIGTLVEILMRRTKRNPILLGPAGSGKTAIVEGLAIRIADGKVPAVLADVHIFEVALLPFAAAVAREPDVLGDFLLEARHPSVIVFFDEAHLLESTTVRDVAESLKPALSRGELACIGATTGQEYQATIENDAALARRFTPVGVEPMDAAAARAVVIAVRDSLAASRGVEINDAALEELLSLAAEHMPNRAFPDKGVDVVEQAIAYALARGLTTVDVATARATVAALIGMDLDPSAILDALTGDLRARGTLDQESADALLARLAVTLRGLDAHRERPDAVVLLAGPASASADDLAQTLARVVFGRSTARIDIDLTGMTEDQSISTLLGSAPGLVGSERPLPLGELRRSPRQVVVFAGIDRSAASLRETIAAGLSAGELSDAMGRSLPFGSAIVILTAPTLGLEELGAALGPSLLAASDVVSARQPSLAPDSRTAWLRSELLEPLVVRFGRQGYQLSFEPGFVDWLAGQLAVASEPPEAFLDRRVTPILAHALPARPGPVRATLSNGAPVLVAEGLPG